MTKLSKKTKAKDSRFKVAEPFIRYWKRCSELQNYFQKENEIESAISIEISNESFKKGKLSAEEIRRLQNCSAVILAPLRFKQKSSNSNEILDIIKIPLQIDSQGNLSQSNLLLPWIPRSLLEPQTQDDRPTVSDIDTVNQFFAKNPYPNGAKYFDLISYCEKFVFKTCGYHFSDFQLENYELVKTLSVTPFDDNIAGNDSIIKLASSILKGKRSLGSLPDYLKIAENKKNYSFTKNFIFNQSLRHVGHFNSKFSLSTSQRSSIYKLLHEKTTSIFPIDGPPGTGKTTVIQSIVANNFVESVLSGKNSPPVTVICGATNQSVINVIDCLNNSNVAHPISERWIPNIKSYGLFCVSQAKSDSATNYHLQKRDGTGFFFDLVSSLNEKQIEGYYLNKFSNQIENCKSINSAKKILKKQLFQLHKDLTVSTKALLQYSIIDRTLYSLFPLELDEYEKEINKLAELDTKYRYLAFLLATHYWEAEWISLLAQFKKSIKQNIGYVHLSKTVWKWKSMLTPALVSTVYMAPRFFQDPDTNVIDLMIMDESGQILPEEGAIISSLAERSICIGDTKQLKPYALIPAELDKNEIIHFKINKKLKANYEELAELGFTSSSGSIMQVAMSSYPKKDPYGPGASLNEHRRSVPEIVKFCNELSYAGRLIPKREPLANPLFRAFSIVNIQSNSTRVGSSRVNHIEAEAIARWLKNYETSIKAYYRTENLAEVLAVLTPFNAQAKILKNKVENNFRNLTIGTVNSLQGAEKAIILFSTVYDEQDKTKYMLDKDATLLNVAVSRAKDSFIVFGDIAMLRGKSNLPSNILANYLS